MLTPSRSTSAACQRAAAQHRRPGQRTVPAPQISRPDYRRRISGADRRRRPGDARSGRGRTGRCARDGRRTAGPWRRGADRRRGRTGTASRSGRWDGCGDGRAGRPSAGHSAPAAASSASPARAPRNRSAYTTDAAPTTSGRSSPSSASCRPARSRRRAGRPGPRGRGGRAGERGTGPGSGINRPAGGPGSFRPPTGDGRGFRPAPAGSSVGRSRQTLPSASITASWNVGRTSVMASPVRDGCTRFVSSAT